MRATTALLFAVTWCAPVQTARGQAIPVRKLSAPERVATEKVEGTSTVRPLSNGRVIVASRRKVLAFDSTLATFSIVADSSTLTPGTRVITQISIIPGVADTTLIVDLNASGFLVADPNGKVVRARAAPLARDVSSPAFALSMGSAMIDPKGRLMYRGSFPRPSNATGAGQPLPSVALDTFPIVRADFDTRVADTLAVVSTPSGTKQSVTVNDTEGRMRVLLARQPFPTTDAWALLPDGSVAIVRGADYHIDWISASGAKTSSPKMPFDWRRISDDEKAKVVDSLTKVNAPINARNDSIAARAGPNTIISRWDVVPVKDFPDYYPPVRDGSVRADVEGNIWILPTTSAGAQGGLLYDIVNRNGVVFERVQLPPDCALGGFAPGRVVYLLCTPPGPRRGPATSLERRRVVN